MLYDGPWTILGHYITIQRWKPEFRPLEESIKRIVAWIRISYFPIEYCEKHFLWRIGNKIGRTLKVDVHTIKEDQIGGELYTIEMGRFARISVEINLDKKLVPKIKIRERTYKIKYEGLSLICFNCGSYGHHKDNCPSQVPSDNLQPVKENKNNNPSY